MGQCSHALKNLDPGVAGTCIRDAVIQQYNNTTDKKARYRPKNPDKMPLGDPQIRNLEPSER